MWPFLGLALLTFICHGWTLWNRGYYWDGWPYQSWISNRRWAPMERFFSEVGMPIMTPLHRWMGGGERPRVRYAAIGFIGLVLISWGIYGTAFAFGCWNSKVCFVLAALAITIPLVHSWMDAVIVPQYILTLASWWIGFGLAVHAQGSWSGEWILWHGVSLVLLWFGFYANALLVFQYAALAFWMGLTWLQGESLSSLILHRLDYGLLPILFWIVKERWTPRHGIYKDYNRVGVSMAHIGGAILAAFRNVWDAPLRDSLAWTFRQPLALWIGIVIALGGGFFSNDHWLPSLEMLCLMVLSGIVFIGAALFAYVMVGKTFPREGLFTRNALLVPWGSSLILLGGIGILGKLFFNATGFVTVCLLFLVWSFLVYYGRLYCLWEAHAAKYEAIIRKLKVKGASQRIRIFAVTDQVSLPVVTSVCSLMACIYIFERAWGARLAQYRAIDGAFNRNDSLL